MEHALANTEQKSVDEEIDIRKTIHTLWRNKWLILAVTLIGLIAGFAYSKLVLPKKYQATAMVVLTKPIFITNFDPRIQASPQLPDTKSLTELAKADDLLQEIIQSPEAAEIFGNETINSEILKRRLQVTLLGLSELRLDVTDQDPQRAAKIANLWANVVANRLNNLFDINEISLAQIQQQRTIAYQKWIETEQALLDYLPENEQGILEVSLDQARDRLAKYLEKITAIDLLVSDIMLFDSKLASQRQNAALSLEDALGLIALQQRSVGGEQLMQIQAAGPDLLGENYTVSQARQSIAVLAASLTEQRKELDVRLRESESEIKELSTRLEEARYHLSQLTTQRDFALSTYQALTSHEEETQIALAQNDQVARVASQALAPTEDAGPHSVLNAAVAGALGLILTIFAIFLVEWWRG